MADSASPIDIATPPRFNSSSPRNQTSNLTFALQHAGPQDFSPTLANALDLPSATEPRLSISRQDSISNGLPSSLYSSGARPISMKDRPRRESNTGSFINGMSWGGVSVGSWIRDDIMMAGTSPANFTQSPSFHSSSYLPKMEASYLKDFNCCGLTLPSLHDLLQHFEECHHSASQTAHRPSASGQGGLAPAGRPTGNSLVGQSIHPDSTASAQHGFRPPQNNLQSFRSHRLGSETFNRTSLSTVQDMDSLEDMEMDDAGGLPAVEEHVPANSFNPQGVAFGRGAQMPPLNVNVTNHQGLRTSGPSTPSGVNHQAAFNLHNNPTVSSVNTPTLGTVPLQGSQNKSSPDSSVPGTPAEFDGDFSNGYMGGMQVPLGSQVMAGNDGNWGANMNFGANNGNTNFDGTIDQPAKRLFSKQGLNQQQLHMALKNHQLGGENSELAKRIREQQILAGTTPIGFVEENKPFRCPVIGCEKAYKNQNGLKYHKQHGHQNQTLQSNADGTFSIVDPETSIPYPGTTGMEKEKPYRCEVCGKRYKNLNGLKYHRAHSPQCNPDLKMQQLGLAGLPSNLQGLNVNVAGAGLAGMDTPMY